MKRMTILTLGVALAAALVPAWAGGAGKAKSLVGTLVDTKCYLALGEKDNDHSSMPGCGTACAKGGNPVGILTAEGKYVTLGVAAPAVAEHVGQTVRAEGEVKEGVLLASKLEVKQGNSWKEIKLGPTM